MKNFTRTFKITTVRVTMWTEEKTVDIQNITVPDFDSTERVAKQYAEQHNSKVIEMEVIDEHEVKMTIPCDMLFVYAHEHGFLEFE